MLEGTPPNRRRKKLVRDAAWRRGGAQACWHVGTPSAVLIPSMNYTHIRIAYTVPSHNHFRIKIGRLSNSLHRFLTLKVIIYRTWTLGSGQWSRCPFECIGNSPHLISRLKFISFD